MLMFVLSCADMSFSSFFYFLIWMDGRQTASQQHLVLSEIPSMYLYVWRSKSDPVRTDGEKPQHESASCGVCLWSKPKNLLGIHLVSIDLFSKPTWWTKALCVSLKPPPYCILEKKEHQQNFPLVQLLRLRFWIIQTLTWGQLTERKKCRDELRFIPCS